MTIKEFNLLKIKVYDGETLVYEGMCNDAPDDLKEKQIKIDKIDGKILIVKLA